MWTSILQLPVHIVLFWSQPATVKSPSQVPTDWAIAAEADLRLTFSFCVGRLFSYEWVSWMLSLWMLHASGLWKGTERSAFFQAPLCSLRSWPGILFPDPLWSSRPSILHRTSLQRLCSVRALRVYVDCTKSFHTSDKVTKASTNSTYGFVREAVTHLMSQNNIMYRHTAQ